jgi:hypothetical protein
MSKFLSFQHKSHVFMCALVIFSLTACSKIIGSSGKSSASATSSASQVAAPAAHKRVFLSSVTHDGNFGGLAGMDTFCTARATAASLGGTWKAYASTSSVSAPSRLTDVSPWYDVDNTTVAVAAKASLSDGSSITGLVFDEFGTAHSGQSVYTGTTSTGTPDHDTCSDWTDIVGNGMTGLTGGGPAPWFWENAQTDFCDVTRRIYCFEQ